MKGMGCWAGMKGKMEGKIGIGFYIKRAP